MIVSRVAHGGSAVADHYDELDAAYRGLWGEHVHHGLWRTGRETPDEAVEALSDLVSERLGFVAGDRLVDIGCGYGGTARRFAARGAEVVGYTLSAAQAAHGPRQPGVAIHCRDWLDNGLPTASRDGAYAIESSEHMPDKPAFFAEAQRVLKPGRPLVVCAWLAAERAPAWQVRHLLRPICEEGALPSMGTAGDYEWMARAAGFTMDTHEDISAAVARTWTICLGRFLKALPRDPALRRLALSGRNRRFALSLPRLILAYRTGAMRYGVFRFVAT